RLSLGAPRTRVVRQLLTESILLSFLGGLLGLLVSLWLTDLIKSLVGKRLDWVGLDGTILGFTAAAALVTGLVFGLAPAVTSSKLQQLLQRAGSRASPSRARARAQDLLISAQIAFAFALLTGAGLLIASLVNLTHLDLGFATDHL